MYDISVFQGRLRRAIPYFADCRVLPLYDCRFPYVQPCIKVIVTFFFLSYLGKAEECSQPRK